MGSTDSRPDGDSVERAPDELKCMFERRDLWPPNARPECGIRRTPPCLIADGSSCTWRLRNIRDNESKILKEKINVAVALEKGYQKRDEVPLSGAML